MPRKLLQFRILQFRQSWHWFMHNLIMTTIGFAALLEAAVGCVSVAMASSTELRLTREEDPKTGRGEGTGGFLTGGFLGPSDAQGQHLQYGSVQAHFPIG